MNRARCVVADGRYANRCQICGYSLPCFCICSIRAQYGPSFGFSSTSGRNMDPSGSSETHLDGELQQPWRSGREDAAEIRQFRSATGNEIGWFSTLKDSTELEPRVSTEATVPDQGYVEVQYGGASAMFRPEFAD